MSKVKDTWETIKKAVQRPKTSDRVDPGHDKILETLAGMGRRRSKADEERIPRSDVLMGRAETLYRIDPLVFGGVNKITRLVAPPSAYFEGQEPGLTKMETFVKDLQLKLLLPDLVKDAVIYGYGCAEILKDDKGNITGLAQIDPKSFDYQRNGNKIERNPDTSITGYVQDVPGEDGKLFTPNDVVLIKFYSLGEESLGISPVESVFKAAWIRLNLEEALGEAIFRHGHPLYYYKIGTLEWEKEFGALTPEKLKEWRKYLKKLDTATELVIPWWITADAISAKSEVGEIASLLEYFSAIVLTGFEIPKIYGVAPKEIQAAADMEGVDFEKTITTMQELLSLQLEEQLFKQFRTKHAADFDKGIPILRFTEYNQTQKLLKSRRLGHYARNTLLTRDDDVENAVRLSEGLPVIKKKRQATADECVFGYSKCKVKEKEKKVTLEELSIFCKVCPKRIRHEKAEELSEE